MAATNPAGAALGFSTVGADKLPGHDFGATSTALVQEITSSIRLGKRLKSLLQTLPLQRLRLKSLLQTLSLLQRLPLQGLRLKSLLQTLAGTR
jgi:hypothetical protein